MVNLGDEVNAYYAVAVARRRDTELTLFNLKRKSSPPAAATAPRECLLHCSMIQVQ